MDSVACVWSALKPHSGFHSLVQPHHLATSEISFCLLSANSGWKGSLCPKFVDHLELGQNSRLGHPWLRWSLALERAVEGVLNPALRASRLRLAYKQASFRTATILQNLKIHNFYSQITFFFTLLHWGHSPCLGTRCAIGTVPPLGSETLDF